MIDFQLYIKNKVTGIYEELKGEVTPLTTEDLLDEALDQAFLVIANTNIELIEPTTEVKVVISQSDKAPVTKYYIVGDDESTETPIGTGFYTHNLTLIERTKLLEGILCQSLTFTNVLGHSWQATIDAPISAVTSFEGFEGYFRKNANRMKSYLTLLYMTPVEEGNLTVKSIYTVANTIASYISGLGIVSSTGTSSSKLTIYKNSAQLQEQSYTSGAPDISINVAANDIIELEYKVVTKTTYLSFGESGGTTEGYTTTTTKYKIFTVSESVGYKPTKPNTITSAIERILDLAEPLFLGETPRFTLNPVQAEKWQNTPLPDTSITQCTLREQLQHIGNFVHSQARLGGYYNGTYYENMIFYDEYGQEEQSTLQGEPYVANVIKHSINEYNTQIDTNAENIVNTLDYAEGVVISPGENLFRTVRTITSNARLSESNCVISTDLPIYDIVKVKAKAYMPDGSTFDNTGEIDITDFVFEINAYNNLTSYGGAYPYAKEYALCYTRGQSNITGLFLKAQTVEGAIFGDAIVAYSIVNILSVLSPNHNWKNYVTNNFPYLSFQVSYIPYYDTKYSHTDSYILGQERNLPFTKIYNQSESAIETRFYGENIKGVAERLGNKEATRTYFLGDINKVPKTGTKLDDYYISNVVTEYMPQSIRCTVGLTEHFNRLSQNVGINSTKRVYEVSNTQAYNRNILLKEYICIGDSTELPFKPSIWQKKRPYLQTTPEINILSTLQMLRGANRVAIGNNNEYEFEDVVKLNTVAIIQPLTKQYKVLTNVKLPVVSSAFGNVMTYSFKMKDNYSSGEQVEETDNGFWQSDVQSGDFYGRAYYLNFQLLDELTINDGLSEALTCETWGNFREKATISTFNNGGGTLDSITPYILRKDSREILKFNLAIEYITNRQDLIIGSALASCNPSVSNSKKGDAQEPIIVPRIYLFNTKINKYAKDILRLYDTSRVGVISMGEQSARDRISFTLPNNVEFTSWAIAYKPTEKTMIVYNEDTGENEEINITEGGEILIACNNGSDYYASKGNYTETLYIKAYSDKLKEYESV